MTREEEIKEASINYTRKNRLNVFVEDKYSEVMREYDRNKAFEEGAKWADKTMIEKACEWLDINFPIIDSIGSLYKESFIKQFKKTMEELL